VIIRGYEKSASASGFTHRTSTTPSQDAEALNKVYQKIRDEYQQFQGLTFLGELRETIHMIRHPADGLLKATSKYLDTLNIQRRKVSKSVRPKRSSTPQDLIRRRRQAVKDGMANSWLELQFGWKPLIQDVQGLAETAARAIVGRSGRKTISATSSEARVTETLFEGVDGNSNGMYQVSYRNDMTTAASVRYLCGLSKEASGPVSSLSQLAKLSGLSYLEFVPTVYELLPWSFLIDYFLNLGDVIGAVCTDTSSVTWINKTVRQVSVSTLTEFYSALPDDVLLKSGGLSGNHLTEREILHTTLVRSKLANLPLPPLVLKVPGTDSLKWFNMAALLAQAHSPRADKTRLSF
jgi:hypothetical protein